VSTASADVNTPSLKERGVYTYKENPYDSSLAGQCTAYSWGRTYEKLGIQMKAAKYPAANLWLTNGWKNQATGQTFTIGAKGQPKANSIAVWGRILNGKEVDGHVAFVENVNGDTISFTESNWHTFSKLRRGGGYDGYDIPLSISKFETRAAKEGTYVLKGYIYLTNSQPTPTIIRVTGTDKVYHVDTNGKIAWIPTVNVFNYWGWDWNSIKDISQAEFNNYQLASPPIVVFKDGLFIQQTGGNEISLISGGARHPFASWNAYLQHGGKADQSNVKPVTASEYSLNGLGFTYY
jgi:surface antigen